MISKPLVTPSILICEEKINLTYALNWKRPVINKKSNSQQHRHCHSFSLHDSDQQTEAEQLSALWVPKLHTIAELSTEFLKKLRPRFQSISSKHCNRKWDTAFLVQHWRQDTITAKATKRRTHWSSQDCGNTRTADFQGYSRHLDCLSVGPKNQTFAYWQSALSGLAKSFAGKHPGRLHTPSLFCTTACSSAHETSRFRAVFSVTSKGIPHTVTISFLFVLLPNLQTNKNL